MRGKYRAHTFSPSEINGLRANDVGKHMSWHFFCFTCGESSSAFSFRVWIFFPVAEALLHRLREQRKTNTNDFGYFGEQIIKLMKNNAVSSAMSLLSVLTNDDSLINASTKYKCKRTAI